MTSIVNHEYWLISDHHVQKGILLLSVKPAIVEGGNIFEFNKSKIIDIKPNDSKKWKS